MELGLNGKVAIVTGASRGIGRAIVAELAREGCDIVAAARTGEALTSLASEVRQAHNRRVVPCAGDLREMDAIQKVVDTAIKEFGKIDIVVNNAGATKRGEFFSLTDADFHDGFALKFHGYVRLSRAAWPHLKKTHGSIINIIGVGGRTAAADFTIGGPVNAALFNFTKALARLGVRDGVRVNGLSPGSIETDRLKGRLSVLAKDEGISEDEARRRNLAQLGVARFGRPDEIGKLVCFLASAPADYIQGALVDMDGGVTRGI